MATKLTVVPQLDDGRFSDGVEEWAEGVAAVAARLRIVLGGDLEGIGLRRAVYDQIRAAFDANRALLDILEADLR